MHLLSSVAIHNFRSCQSVALDLAAYTPFVGYNNAGKSNILSAIRWLVAPFPLGQGDFMVPGQAVCVEGTISGISPAVLNRLDARHRNRVEPFVVNETIQMRRTQDQPGPSRNSVLQVLDQSNATGEWRANPTGIPEAIKALFPEPLVIGAMEDAAEDASKAKTNTTIGKLLGEFTAAIEDAHSSEVQLVLQRLRNSFSASGAQRSAALQRFDEAASALVSDFFPGVRIHLELQVPDIGAMLKAGTIKVSEREGVVRDFETLGHGAQRSIQMALVRYLAETQHRADQDTTAPVQRLLLIDEPELYLHPQAIEQVRSALAALATNGYQVLITTHSPLMIGRDAICDTRLVRKNADGSTTVAQSVQAALQQHNDDPKSHLHTLLELKNSSEWLFSDNVLLVEGKTERRILPKMVEVATGKSLPARKTALVELQGAAAMTKCMDVLSALGIASQGIADLDFALTHARHLTPAEKFEPLLCMVRQQLAALSASDSMIKLAENGLPCRPRDKELGYKPSETVKIWAATPDGSETAKALAHECRKLGIWLWPGGDIEHHLGLTNKDELAWHQFVEQLGQDTDWRNQGFDNGTLDEFFAWIW